MRLMIGCWVFWFLLSAFVFRNPVVGYATTGKSRRGVWTRRLVENNLDVLDNDCTSADINRARNGHPQVVLLSLNCPKQIAGEFSKTVSDVWKWKDAVLGDGRDYFIPRTKTLSALQAVIQSSFKGNIDSIAILSNCARLEILIICMDCGCGGTDALLEECLTSVSTSLLRQVKAHQMRRFQPPPLDWPSSIVTEPFDDAPIIPDDQVNELARQWTCFSNITSALTHWCNVAAGLSERPNRPGRRVEFRPYSSRDAHILLQLKRTVALGRARWCVDTALSAGKAARSNDIVRAHKTSDSTRAMPLEVAIQVQKKVLEPLIQKAVSDWNAKSSGEAIRQLRERAFDLATTDHEKDWIKRTQLHDATMALRQQDRFDVETFLHYLKHKLEEERLSRSN